MGCYRKLEGQAGVHLLALGKLVTSLIHSMYIGDVHLAFVVTGYLLAVAIPILRLSAWKNTMGFGIY